jgi:hypothetical protein
MNLKEAKEIFEEIAELCSKIEDHRLNEALESIYRDVENSDSIQDILELLTDLMFYVDDVSWENDIEYIKIDIQNLYNKFQDEAE